MARVHPEPRYIRPETIDIGDTIRVTFPKHQGMTNSITGTVAKREEHGMRRHMLTEEGGRLLVWEPGKHENFRVTLLDRNPKREPEQLEIFNNETGADIGELRKRL